MTIDLPISWIALLLGALGFGYGVLGDYTNRRRLDQLEKVTAGLRGDITEIIRDHRNNLAAVNARIDSLHIPEPREPATLPLTIVRGVPTDTAPGIAAVGAAVRQVFDDDAHTRGRHAHREGVDA